jgi:tetratricopeptide (TPR) repeat protein
MVASGGKQEKADFVKLLIEYGASLFIKDKQGFYAIDYARAKGYTNTATLLTNTINNKTLTGSGDFKDRGEYYYHQKEFAKAVIDFSEAIKLSPSNATFYYYRGTANYKSGNKTASEADFAKVLQLNPGMAKAIEEERARLSSQ